MRKKLLLIGGGVIAMHYKTGLERSPKYELVALADIDPHCAARPLFPVPFFTDYREALVSGAEVAMISVSANAHYPIARELLERGVSVITEKPMCEDYGKISDLCALSAQKNVQLGCLFHWMYADEVRYLKAHRKELGRIERIAVHVFDDYAATADGSIRTDRKGLCGAWRDSGINILSYLGELCDLHDFRLLSEEYVLDPTTKQDKYAQRTYRFGKTLAEITVDWRTPSREKKSEILCERGVVQVDHTAQTVKINGKTAYAHPVPDRLSGHYETAFAEFTCEKADLEHALLLHRILFEGGTP